MLNAMLIQLPVPQLNFGRQTANIPLAAACLQQATAGIHGVHVEIMSESAASYLGDAALLDVVLQRRPQIIGFSTYAWNLLRVLGLARQIKAHYQPRIVLGGPEVTPDNALLRQPDVDFLVFGEGEAVFRELLCDAELWNAAQGRKAAGEMFQGMPSPCLTVPLELHIENMLLLETMRGCPYGCAYCYYHKSLRRPNYKADRWVLESVGWALSQGLKQIYLLDPSLNSRPGLKALLREIARLNKGRRIKLISEMRAEAIDDEMADLLAAAGFTWLEIGLQSTNPRALEMMQRPTDLQRFAAGVRRLRERKVVAGVDLIAGLPGDDWEGFTNSLAFVSRNRCADDIQVFPLAVLPGTEFRQHAGELGLVYDPLPPYTVLRTPDFSEETLYRAMDLSESHFDTILTPEPDLDLAWRGTGSALLAEAKDITVVLEHSAYVNKVILRPGRSNADLEATARRVTHPYQLFVPPEFPEPDRIFEIIGLFTSLNPHTPLELVFFEPAQFPAAATLLAAARLRRPHYLDSDLRYLYPESGNRAMLFTVVTVNAGRNFQGLMQRLVHWWRFAELPSRQVMEDLQMQHFDGLLIDAPVDSHVLEAWQDRTALRAAELPLISFADLKLQKRWVEKTAAEDYFPDILATA